MAAVTAKPRLDVRKLVTIRTEVRLRPDEYFSETPKCFRLCDKFGIKATYPKNRITEIQLFEGGER